MKQTKIAMVLSAIASFICVGFVLYNTYAKYNFGQVIFWALFWAANSIMLIADYIVYQNEKKKISQLENKEKTENKED